MFTLEGVLAAPDSAEATARYWAWRSSQAGTPEEESLLRSKIPSANAGQVGVDDGYEEMIQRIVAHHGRPSTEAGRLAIYHALHADLSLGLKEERQKRDGVLHQTDYMPVGRMAIALAGVDPTGLPVRVTTSTQREFAYVAEHERPFTVIHGDLAVVQAHLVEAHHRVPEEIVPLVA